MKPFASLVQESFLKEKDVKFVESTKEIYLYLAFC